MIGGKKKMMDNRERLKAKKIKKEVYIKENSSMVKKMAEESILIKMEEYITDFGEKT